MCAPTSVVILRQHRTIPALRLKHRSGGCGTASALPKCSIMSGCGTRIVSYVSNGILHFPILLNIKGSLVPT